MHWYSIMPSDHMSASRPYSRWNTSGAMYTARTNSSSILWATQKAADHGHLFLMPRTLLLA
jgi:hypothetical protein